VVADLDDFGGRPAANGWNVGPNWGTITDRSLGDPGVAQLQGVVYQSRTGRHGAPAPAGRFVFYYSTWTGFSTVFWPQSIRLNPAVKLRPVPPFSADGKSKPRFLLPAVLLSVPVARLLAPLPTWLLGFVIGVLGAASVWFSLFMMTAGWPP